MKKVIIINLGWEQEPLINTLSKEYDVELYGVHYNNNYYDEVEYKEVLITDLRNLDSILEFAAKIIPDAVISDQCDYSYFAQSVIAERFNLCGPSIDSALIATNKYLQRIKSRENNILIPEFELCKSIKEVEDFVNKKGYPIILKPADNRGSFGVNKINKKEDIKDFFIDSLINSYSRFVLAEEFIDGIHITVDGYAFKEYGPKSLSLATKILKEDKEVAMEILYPGELDIQSYNKCLINNEQVNKSLEYNFGMIHSEYMIKDGKPYLIESANRGGGVYTSEIIVPKVSNVDILRQYIDDCLNIKNNYFKRKIEKNCVILKFIRFESGKIKKINGLSQLKNNPYLLNFRLSVKEGDIIKDITNDGNRHGFVIVSGENKLEAKSHAQNIINSIEVIYESY